MFPVDVDFDDITNEIDETINDIEASDKGIFPCYDIIKGDFVFDKKGNVKMAHSTKAIEEWIIKILNTYIERYYIYYDKETFREYGTNIVDIYRGEKINSLLRLGLLEQEVKDALLTNRNILRVDNFDLTSHRHILTIEFSVILADEHSTQLDIQKEVRIPRD